MVLRSASLSVLTMLSVLGKAYEIRNVGLYRDDGLACLRKISGTSFRQNTGRYHQNFPGELNFIRLYIRSMHRKALTLKRTYINVNSNYPPNIIKALPDSISQRISNISSDKATFSNAAPFCNYVLSGSVYKENLTYQQDLP